MGEGQHHQHHHRSTLKQQNKSFKSKHATKSSLKDAAKGRVARQSPKTVVSSNTAAQARLNRKNNAKQQQLKKRNALISATRVFNGVDGAPRIVAVIPLSEDVNVHTIVSSLAESLDVSTDNFVEEGLWKMRADRFKTSLQFVNVPYRHIYAALDACKVADYVVFALSTTVEVDAWGDTLLRALQAQGLPDVVTVVSPDSLIDVKTRPGIIKSLLSFIQYFVPVQSRVFDLESGSDRLNALRALSEGKPADVRWREGRSWVLGENLAWNEGTLQVTGIVRGSSMSPNRLVHIPNFGDFQISKIMSAPLSRHSKSNHASMDIGPVHLAEPEPSSADSLVSCNDPDDMANEQTWPTEEEMSGAYNNEDGEYNLPDAKLGTTPKVVKRIPKGMSEYQASWIVDESDNEENEGDDDGKEDDEMEMAGAEEEMVDMPIDEDNDIETDARRSVTFQDLDHEEESKQLQSWRNREREEENDLSFPDELDTPQDVSAQTRFQRFRGMRSFRTSPWDPFENLPRDYARIFQFEDYKRTERNVRRRAEQETTVVEPGTRITLYINGVPEEAAKCSPLTLFSLLQHEHKVSVLNFTVQRNTEYDRSVRSKDPLILCVGPRRLNVNPIYSQHTRGGGKGSNNVHKFERFFRHGITVVATIYGPVVFGKQPCVLLRETSDPQAPHLVAMGTFLNPDTTRVIAKRAILTGHPFKVHKKTATVRYMFFNSDDIHYFKPIQLHTKHGRIGHIRESLGTHGYFKAHFDGPINQMDTVCMSLYKRVFPKWATMWEEPEIGQDKLSDAMEE
ncbi:ribosome biogenesis protein tsr1 [Guyanagaster necrorhizus]|uniref:Ribosome biogenesis protein tsr1 n=1 Tax=Guyanagaster necrorhizus TaxID=856835 RepID=A0A9P8AU48_9AGAR|nr:ribosome biogenesis protein tsr1 [Guyanagaster necrorhizus MCA 3950]KAG7446542.1 ribosome biogenesis protein tsr1 [Guyanagaster necrorhizus MCA 3950]